MERESPARQYQGVEPMGQIERHPCAGELRAEEAHIPRCGMSHDDGAAQKGAHVLRDPCEGGGSDESFGCDTVDFGGSPCALARVDERRQSRARSVALDALDAHFHHAVSLRIQPRHLQIHECQRSVLEWRVPRRTKRWRRQQGFQSTRRPSFGRSLRDPPAWPAQRKYAPRDSPAASLGFDRKPRAFSVWTKTPPTRRRVDRLARAMLPEQRQVLIVDDEPNLRRILSAQLTRDGYEVLTADDGEQGLALLRENHIDLIITDLKMPRVDGMTLLKRAIEEEPELPVVVITAHGTIDTAVEALKIGAFDFVTKPFDKDELRQIVAKALKTRELRGADATPTPVTHGARFGIIGTSTGITELYAILERVADQPTTVLITGESGTGKELVARALHEHSARKDKPFIKVNCAAIPKELIESELFGYERGAFTGAVTSKPGRFELASGGTLFLDEIGEVPVEMQVKLLRVLQESEFERVGGIKTIRVDVRLVAATNRDLKKLIVAGGFRDDLFYRLNVVPIRLPPLRERVGDIPLLVDHFLAKFNERLKKNVEGLEPAALELLGQYPWPGNIRELENVIERAVLFCDTQRLRADDLPPDLRGISAMSTAPLPEADLQAALAGEGGLKEHVKVAMSRLERELVSRALQQTGGNVTHAARLLKISRKGLQLKMKELGLREAPTPDSKGE